MDEVSVIPLLIVRFLQVKEAVIAVLLAMMASVVEVGAEGLQAVPFQVDWAFTLRTNNAMHVNAMVKGTSFFITELVLKINEPHIICLKYMILND